VVELASVPALNGFAAPQALSPADFLERLTLSHGPPRLIYVGSARSSPNIFSTIMLSSAQPCRMLELSSPVLQVSWGRTSPSIAWRWVWTWSRSTTYRGGIAAT